jgi:hypothetical protein
LPHLEQPQGIVTPSPSKASKPARRFGLCLLSVDSLGVKINALTIPGRERVLNLITLLLDTTTQNNQVCSILTRLGTH